MSTHNISFSIQNRQIKLNYSKSAATGFFSKGLENELEITMENKPSVFEPLKFYCKNTKSVLDKNIYNIINSIQQAKL